VRGLIYTPSGRAAEYASKALNYYNSCDHSCSYCFMADLLKGFNTVQPDEVCWTKQFSLVRLEAELIRFAPKEEVLLCFSGDPYCRANDRLKTTRRVLQLFLQYKVPTRILSKGGCRCLQDEDLFLEFVQQGVPISIGQTLTFWDNEESRRWEPGAAPPADRLWTLTRLHDAGIPTWASFEPVIDPDQTLRLMEYGLPFIDEYKVGKLNHRPELERTIDWRTFGNAAEEMLKDAGKQYILKKDLIKEMGRSV
jgi:DNA repair photolyase